MAVPVPRASLSDVFDFPVRQTPWSRLLGKNRSRRTECAFYFRCSSAGLRESPFS